LRARLQEECFNMTAEWDDSCGSDLVTKIINFWESKTAYLKVDNQTILYQELQDNSEMFQVKASTTARHQNIIKINKNIR